MCVIQVSTHPSSSVATAVWHQASPVAATAVAATAVADTCDLHLLRQHRRCAVLRQRPPSCPRPACTSRCPRCVVIVVRGWTGTPLRPGSTAICYNCACCIAIWSSTTVVLCLDNDRGSLQLHEMRCRCHRTRPSGPTAGCLTLMSSGQRTRVTASECSRVLVNEGGRSSDKDQ